MKKITKISILIFTFCCSISLIFSQPTLPILTLNTNMHTAKISKVSTDASGKFILTCSVDKTAKLWDAVTGSLLKTFRVPINQNDDGMLYAGSISPDGKTIVVGGWTGYSWDKKHSIYIFDVASNTLKQRITGLSTTINDINFSTDGNYIVASLNDGIKIFDTNTWKLIKSFSDYGARCSNARFDNNGRLATISDDGKIRLYSSSFEMINNIEAEDNSKPNSLSFSSNGSLLAVSYLLQRKISVFDGKTLKLLYEPDVSDRGISTITFSFDDKYLIAGFSYPKIVDGKNTGLIRVWSNQGKGKFNDYTVGSDFIIDIKPLPNNAFVYCGRSPFVGSMKIDGTELFLQKNEINSYYPQDNKHSDLYLQVNNSGSVISVATNVVTHLKFSLKERLLNIRPYDDWSRNGWNDIYKDSYSGINVKFWDKSLVLNINGKEGNFFLKKNEVNYSVDISNDAKKMAFGTNWNIYCTDANAKELWSTRVQSPATCVNISENDKILVACIGDGTIKWYSMNVENEIKIIEVFDGSLAQKSGLMVNDIVLSVNDNTFNSKSEFFDFVKDKKEYQFKILRNNVEKLIRINKTEDSFGFASTFFKDNLLFTLYLHPDNKRWILWSPKGYFDCSSGAESLIGWHVNQGADKEGLYYPASQFFEKFYVPNLGASILAGEEIKNQDISINNFKLPPLVKIISPENNTKINTEQITVSVEVTDQGGGIDEILLYHNEKLISTTNRGFKQVLQSGSKQTKTFTISLSNGENKIRATAFNSQRTEANPDEITIFFNSVQVSKPNLYLFVIGINEYKNAKYNLNYAVADAQGFKQQIEQGSSSIFGNIKTIFINNVDATKPKILQELNNVKSQTKQEDVFIFYYAGHGVMSEEQIPQFYIIPHDVTQMYGNEQLLQSTGISATELKQFSTEIKAQKQLYILDACQSGGMVGMLASRGASEEKAINQLARSTGTYWLAASNSEQVAGEFAQLGHGIFTYCILQGLSGKADSQSDKKITVQELSSYLNDQVPILSKQYKGSEQYPNTYGYGHDFPIVIIK